jgi:hypothetical protein
MQNLILQPTSMAQWQMLVREAAQSYGLKLSEDLESYLVFLLQRFMVKPEVADTTLALEYLQSYNVVGNHQRYEQLREVGDKCLLFSGFFPEQAIQRHVSVVYFVDMGRQAYQALSTLFSNQGRLFKELTYQFVHLMDTLHCMREINNSADSISPLQAEELWRIVGSPHAHQVLRRHTQGFIVETNEKSEFSMH